jgi:recombinational DNA repair protein (RecF pathway)
MSAEEKIDLLLKRIEALEAQLGGKKEISEGKSPLIVKCAHCGATYQPRNPNPVLCSYCHNPLSANDVSYGIEDCKKASEEFDTFIAEHGKVEVTYGILKVTLHKGTDSKQTVEDPAKRVFTKVPDGIMLQTFNSFSGEELKGTKIVKSTFEILSQPYWTEFWRRDLKKLLGKPE